MAYSYGYGPPQDHEFAEFGSWLSKAVKSVGSAVKSTAQGFVKNPLKETAAFIAAPLVVPTAALVKASTWSLAQTGAKPLVKLDAAVGGITRSDIGKTLGSAFISQMVVGAAVGTAIVAAPAIGSALSAVGGTAATAAADIAKKNLAGLSAKPVTPAVVPIPAGTVPPSTGPSLATVLAGAGAGFLVAGPPGALVGGGAGYVIGRK